MTVWAKAAASSWRRWAPRSAALIGLLAFVALVVGPSTPAAAATTVVVPVGDFWFCDPSFVPGQAGVCETKIQVGDTVEWDFNGSFSFHTTTDCGGDCDFPTATPLWDSGLLLGGSYQFTFNQPGTYIYLCSVHPFTMQGQITVNPPQSVGGFVVDLDSVQEGLEAAQVSDSGHIDALAGAALAVIAVTALGSATWYARRRWLR